MSEATHPKEAFGVFTGRIKNNVLLIERVIYQPFSNTSTSALAQIDDTIPNIVGTFHSHPGTDASPSNADKRLFARRSGIHCIVAEPYVRAHVYNAQGTFIGTEHLVIAKSKLAENSI